MHEWSMSRVGTVDSEATLQRLIPAPERECLDHLCQSAGVFQADSAVTIEIVHLPIAVIIDIDVGGIAIDVPAVAGLVAYGLVIEWCAISAHDAKSGGL